jgi:hypothetical protein
MIRDMLGIIYLFITFPWGYLFIDRVERWMLKE